MGIKQRLQRLEEHLKARNIDKEPLTHYDAELERRHREIMDKVRADSYKWVYGDDEVLRYGRLRLGISDDEYRQYMEHIASLSSEELHKKLNGLNRGIKRDSNG